MKLIQKINYNFFSLAILITFVGGMIFYVMLRRIMIDKTDSRLLESKETIDNNFGEFLINPSDFVWDEELISISVLNGKASEYLRLNDTIIGNKVLNNLSPFRKLEFEKEFAGKNYKIKIFKDLSFTDSLTLQIMFLLGLMAIFFLMSFFLVFKFVVHGSLQDFYSTISKVRLFKVGENEALKLEKSDVEEFENLNKVLRFMTDKINKDYFNLKEFTQNASHEIQTPLAIIQNKVELLIQDDKITENQIEAFSTIMEATTRLSNLNKGLTQLVKIESGQYVDKSIVDLEEVIDKNHDYLEEMLDAKEISFSKNANSELKININENLLELLIFNLLKNALKHNIQGGKILVEINSEEIIISNTGESKKLDFESLSQRFSKGKDSKSLGLGLAIVMKICSNYNIDVSYSFRNDMHSLKLNFKELL